MVSPDAFKQWIDGTKPVTVVDIQSAGEYEAYIARDRSRQMLFRQRPMMRRETQQGADDHQSL
jgi:hypothetical protein